MIKKQHIAVLLGGVLLGCGGSSGFNSGFPDPPATKVDYPTGPGIDGGSTLRTYKAGDTWIYNVSGTMLREEYDDQAKLKTKNSGPVTGKLIRQVSAITFQGAPALKFTDALTYAINGGLTTVEILEHYARQEASGDLTMLGRRDNNTDCGNATKVWLPASFVAGSNRGGVANFTGLGTYRDKNGVLRTYDDSLNTSTAMSVTAQQSVPSTSGAPFTTWRAVYAERFANDFAGATRVVYSSEFIGPSYKLKSVEEISAVDDWAASLGAPVQRGYQTTRTDTIVDKSTIDTTTGVVTFEVHLEKRMLDLRMVLVSRTLQ